MVHCPWCGVVHLRRDIHVVRASSSLAENHLDPCALLLPTPPAQGTERAQHTPRLRSVLCRREIEFDSPREICMARRSRHQRNHRPPPEIPRILDLSSPPNHNHGGRRSSRGTNQYRTKQETRAAMATATPPQQWVGLLTDSASRIRCCEHRLVGCGRCSDGGRGGGGKGA